MNCSICQEQYEDPVTLSCGHTFCKGCISGLVKLNAVVCPECRGKTQCPNGKDSLKINIVLRDMLNKGKQKAVIDDQADVKKLILETYLNDKTQIVIEKIEKINNLQLKLQFDKTVQQLGANTVVTKLHGTYPMCVDGIIKEGFKLPTKNKRLHEDQEGELTFGKAIYFSSFSTKAVNYGTNVIIVCDIVLGKIRHEHESQGVYDENTAKTKKFNTIFYQTQNQYNVDYLKGSITDEYALYNPAQVLPKYVVRYKIVNKLGMSTNLEYKKIANFDHFDTQEYIKAIQVNPQQAVVSLLTFGDVFRDHQTKAVQAVFKYSDQYFLSIKQIITQPNEQLLLHVLRVLWNSSYKNRYMQAMIVQKLGVDIFVQLAQHKHESVIERSFGVIQNLTELEENNSMQFEKAGLIPKLLQQLKNSIAANKWNQIKYILGTIANILKFKKCNVNDPLINQINELVTPLIDCQIDEIRDEALRVLSNQIGYTEEWLQNGYIPLKGLQKI